MAPTTIDGLATLDQALAFFDFCEDGAAIEGKSATAASLSFDDIDDLLDAGPVSVFPASSTGSLSPSDMQEPSSTRKKKRRRSAASSSTVMQRRKKAEMEALRAEATQLEGCLAQLRRTGNQHATSDEEEDSDWHRRALAQYKERHESEQINWRLKEILQKQWRVSSQLKGMLNKRNVLSGMDFVQSFESPCFEDAYFTFDQSSMLMLQLELQVQSVYQDFDRVYRLQNGPVVNTTSQTVYNETCEANVMNFVTSTPLDWPLKTAFNHVWGYLESSLSRSRKPNTVETKVIVTLPVQGSSEHFHKLHFLRKFEEKDRTIVIWSDLLQSTSKSVRVRSLAHAVFTRSETNPSTACVMYTHLKLYLESPTTSEQKPSAEEIQDAQEEVLRGMGRLMRQFWQDEQNRLLELTCY